MHEGSACEKFPVRYVDVGINDTDINDGSFCSAIIKFNYLIYNRNWLLKHSINYHLLHCYVAFQEQLEKEEKLYSMHCMDYMLISKSLYMPHYNVQAGLWVYDIFFQVCHCLFFKKTRQLCLFSHACFPCSEIS